MENLSSLTISTPLTPFKCRASTTVSQDSGTMETLSPRQTTTLRSPGGHRTPLKPNKPSISPSGIAAKIPEAFWKQSRSETLLTIFWELITFLYACRSCGSPNLTPTFWEAPALIWEIKYQMNFISLMQSAESSESPNLRSHQTTMSIFSTSVNTQPFTPVTSEEEILRNSLQCSTSTTRLKPWP